MIQSGLSRYRGGLTHGLAGTVLVLALILAPGLARAFETHLPVAGTPAALAFSGQSGGNGMIDPCLSYLNPVRFETARAAMITDQRSAGQAAIGLVLGVQFALGPVEKSRGDRRKTSGAGFNIWTPRADSSAQALAVAEYRRCKNKQTLEAMAQ